MFNNKNTAFVVTDPQVEFLKPKGAGYGLTKDILRKYHTTENLTELFKHAKAKAIKSLFHHITFTTMTKTGNLVVKANK